MRLTIVPSDKMIILDGEPVQCSHVDLSWIPTDVHAVQWDGAKNSGQVEYNTEGKFPQIINEISVWQQAATDHANEKIAQANEREGGR